MNSVERVKKLCKERKIPISKLEKELGFSNGYIGQLKRGTFPDDRIRKIADYLGVTAEYLMTGKQVALHSKPAVDVVKHFAGGVNANVYDENVLELNIDMRRKERLLHYFQCLNAEGKSKAIEQIKILSKVPEYQDEEYQTAAAHGRTDVEYNAEEAESDLDMMSDDKF